ncbi:hypothetical protein HQ571_03625 [Candidatus Kuenenbacteria bacterium]|nr:hypothetical protein [Candidatus Kuenenbacteria bacterium]
MTDQVLVRFIHTDDGEIHGRIVKDYNGVEVSSISVKNRRSVVTQASRHVKVMRRQKPAGRAGRVIFLLGYTRKNKDQWSEALPANQSHWICQIVQELAGYLSSNGRTAFLVRLIRESTES